MSLRFIIGRAGTGKTSYCLQEIHKELLARPRGPGIILLVPEQSTFYMERALVLLPGLGGAIRAHVYSFRRLAWRVLQEAGGGARTLLRETGKRMILRNLLNQRKDQLKVFHQVARQPNFADSLAQVIGEMKMYCVTPAELSRIAADLGQENLLLRDKLQDLSLLYGDLEQFLAGRFIDPDDYLSLLAERLPLSHTCRGAEVWVDGFSGFTPQEYRVLKGLLMVSSRVNVALCCDSSVLGCPPDEQELFYHTHRTYDTLLDLAYQAGADVEESYVLDNVKHHRFTPNPALNHLERYFFTWPRQVYSGPVSGIKLVAAHNRRAEVEGAAREIIALLRDHGYRWREISVLVRDITQYDELLERVFADYDIPYFIDFKRPVSHHPLIELMRAALETVTSKWAHAPVIRYLKTDLVPVTREEVDQLENYVLAHGIRGTRWTDGKPWSYRRYYSIGDRDELTADEACELELINDIKARAITHLNAFAAAVSRAGTVRDISAALYGLLDDLEVKKTLEGWSEKARESGELDRAREHAQVYNQVILLLDEMVEALGDSSLPVEAYIKVLEAGLENLRLGLIPPGLDQVFVGSLDRSRNPNVRANFLLGVNEGVLPARPSADGLLSDSEREVLLASGLNLAPDDKRKLFDEQYLIYLGLTRASEYLWISYALADQAGNSLNPSRVITDIRSLFPEVKERTCPMEPDGNDDIQFIVHPGQALSHLTARLREAKMGMGLSPLWRDVYNWLVTNEEYWSRRVLASLFYVNREDSLAPGTRKILYGSSLRASITQVEQFISCPFAHFLQFGLRVRERETHRVRPVDLGQFFHAAMKMFVEYVEQEGLDWEELTQEKCSQLIDKIMACLVPQLQNEILMSSARQQYLAGKLRRVIEISVNALVEQTCCGSFRPYKLEVGFGFPEGLRPLKSRTSKGIVMTLVGRIDRIDIARSGEQVYLRVIDYKSGSTDLNLSDIYHGLRLQLLAYLDVVLDNARVLTGQEAVPGGVFYFGIKNPIINAQGPMSVEEARHELRKRFKLEGMVLAEMSVIELMERGLTGDSQVIPVGIKKDGDFKANSRVITREQFTRLRFHLHRVLEKAGLDILAGQVGIEPFYMRKKKACNYCRFKPICQFDVMTGNNYRLLKELKKEEIWRLLEEGDEA